MAKKKADKELDLADILAGELNKQSKDSKVAFFLNDDEAPTNVDGWISTGCAMLDVAVSNRPYGGLPVGRITEITGLEQSGKSLVSAHLLAETQKQGGVAVLIDTETAVSREFLEAIGVDISNHQSQPITGRLAKFADVILTMTNGHRQALISHWPMLETRTKTIRRDGGDIGDPIGRPIAIYRSTAEQIDQQLAEWVPEFDLSRFE